MPESWSGRRINLVFNGVMTDASVKVNGRSAGPTHIGAFYQFKYDITALLKKEKGAENVLEVEVAKTSSSPESNLAEHAGDYWCFGGIFRPVWLEALPASSIEHVAIDARADGNLTADLTLGFRGPRRLDGTKLLPETIVVQVLGADGQPAGEPVTQKIPHGGTGRLKISTQIKDPALWTAETPNLYSLRISRKSGDRVVHTVTQRFAFRTFEVRDGQGLFLNGQRILLKGVNRPSFRPDTGRALDPEDCYADARLIKAMNMNAVRMSHYPPDEAFLDACDELGLYVLDELSSWQNAHSTEVGRRLVREMVERDVNHPSVLFWENGNEGGWNRDLDGDFTLYDPQQRRVLHPWDPFSGIDTRHYPAYSDLIQRVKGPHLVMPTEFLHGLYDGGAGAGLEDNWNAIAESPVGAGGFIWTLADEGVRRDDQNGRIDVFGTYAPDGIVGPHHEKEGSYHTVRNIWSPVQIAKPVIDEKFTGRLTVSNRYDFTSLAKCRFEWKLVRYPGPADVKAPVRTLAEGSVPSPAVPPHGSGELAVPLPANWRKADALSVVAFSPDQQELWNWVWPLPAIARQAEVKTKSVAPKVETAAGEIHLIADDLTASFDASSSLLKSVRRGDRTFALSNGPRLSFAKPESAGAVEWLPFASEDPATHTYQLASRHLASTAQVELDFNKSIPYACYKLEVSPDGRTWKTLFDGSCRVADLKSCNFAPQRVTAVRISNPRRHDGQSLAIKSVRLGYAAAAYPIETTAPATVTTGNSKDSETGKPVAWLESRGAAGLNHFRWSLSGDGDLRLDYDYTLNGDFLHHGISFDLPATQMKSLRWLGDGPYRVWQNRLRGTWLGIHETACNDTQTGESWGYPEFQGIFAGLRWANLETPAGRLTVASASPDVYLRVGTPRISHANTTVVFPTGDLSFLHAIPAMGSKVNLPERSGPTGQPAKASGDYRGTLTFTFGSAEP
ncbi:MAG: DUF4981 domain-containing protein [Verrucomicrobia bacterium]|nr:DUF4981 domain-containing protein [Verrucomicrobiota bacterium]